MASTRAFKTGDSRSIGCSKELQAASNELTALQQRGEIILRKTDKGLAQAFKLLTELPNDFLIKGREDEAPQIRKKL